MKFKEMKIPVEDMRAWGCREGIYSFVITLETRMGGIYAGWTGYSCSYSLQISKKVHRFGEAVNSLEEAIKMCEDKLNQLKGN